MNLNHVTLAGRLTRDPEIRSTQSGLSVTDLALAVSRFYKTDQGENREDVDFIDCTAFGKTAETLGKHLRKGRAVYLEGRLKFEQYSDKEGQKRSRLRVIIESMQFVGPKPSDEPLQVPLTQEQQSRAEAALIRQREAAAHQNVRQED
jgi:single-strand DNA-binding protein